MKHPHFILVLGMAAWFSAANPEMASTDFAGLAYTENTYRDANLDGQTHSVDSPIAAEQPESTPQTGALHDEMQREQALQLMEMRRLDSRRSALQFLPFEPESRR